MSSTSTQGLTQFVRVQRIKKREGILYAAAAHNLREIRYSQGAATHIDKSRTKSNLILEGASTAKEVAILAQTLMDQAGVKKLRKDAVVALEVIFSLPTSTTIYENAYFRDCLAWVRNYYSVPLLCAVAHHDESAPHCHVLMLPLINQRMQGSRLFGTSFKLQILQSDFYEKVGKKYGMQKKPRKKRWSIADRRAIAARTIEIIKRNPESMGNPDFVDALMAALSANPEPLEQALGRH